MVGRGKSKQARSEELDRISELPNPLKSQILSHLPTKDAVKTSFISTAWRSLWLWVPQLELDSREFADLAAFVKFGDRFFDLARTSSIHKLNLTLDRNEDEDEDASYLTPWIDAAVKRKVQHVHFRCSSDKYLYEMPKSLYICETLVSLELYKMKLVDSEVFSLPCLKTLQLKLIWYTNESTLERLVSSCPLLEELKILVGWNDLKLYRVKSRSLKKFFFIRTSSASLRDSVSGVVIDAPLLRVMCIYDNVSKSFQVDNLEHGAKLGLALDFGLEDLDEAGVSSRRNRVRSFLPGISRASFMTIDADTFKLIHDYFKLEPLPQFRYMSRLSVTLCVSDLKGLPTFLESCPNLEVLNVALNDYEEMNHNSFFASVVPECLLSSLKIVDLDIRISGYAAE
uniref:Putative FBD-associated F-box protein n=1 Tax=Noccaea caerulescens TaxID=107243 RepID=A0A1J3FBE0_NOCCA